MTTYKRRRSLRFDYTDRMDTNSPVLSRSFDESSSLSDQCGRWSLRSSSATNPAASRYKKKRYAGHQDLSDSSDGGTDYGDSSSDEWSTPKKKARLQRPKRIVKTTIRKAAVASLFKRRGEMQKWKGDGSSDDSDEDSFKERVVTRRRNSSLIIVGTSDTVPFNKRSPYVVLERLEDMPHLRATALAALNTRNRYPVVVLERVSLVPAHGPTTKESGARSNESHYLSDGEEEVEEEEELELTCSEPDIEKNQSRHSNNSDEEEDEELGHHLPDSGKQDNDNRSVSESEEEQVSPEDKDDGELGHHLPDSGKQDNDSHSASESEEEQVSPEDKKDDDYQASSEEEEMTLEDEAVDEEDEERGSEEDSDSNLADGENYAYIRNYDYEWTPGADD